MAIHPSFSKRQRKLRESEPDVFRYDEIPSALRVQLVLILRDAIGEDASGTLQATKVYEHIESVLAREYGVFALGKKQIAQENIEFFIQHEEDPERVLDVIELAMQVMNRFIADNIRYQGSVKNRSKPESVLLELNARFLEHGIGYRFESNEMIRVDSEILHQEATRPALRLLAGPGLKGANEEFLEAHEHYRNHRHKECLVSALKAFESTMRVICLQRGWSIEPTANASKLIGTLFANDFLPSFLESEFSALRSLLESGIPTVRNNMGGHGQGGEIKSVPEHIARYALNLTASSILFLVESNNAANS